MSHVAATRVAGVALASLLAAATQAVAQQPSPSDRPNDVQHKQTHVQPGSHVQPGTMNRHNVRNENRGMIPNQRSARDENGRTMRQDHGMVRNERFARGENHRTMRQDHGTVRNERFARDENRRTIREDRGRVRNERFAGTEERRTIRKDRVGEERFGQERLGQAPVGYENGTYGTEEARGRIPRDRTHIVGWTAPPPAPAYVAPGWNGSYAYNQGAPYYDYNGYYNGGPNPVDAVVGGALGLANAATLGIFGGPYYNGPYYNGYGYPGPNGY